MYIPERAMQVSKWGNSLAVRLPKAVVEALGLKEGDSIDIEVMGRRKLEVGKSPDNQTLLASLRKYRGSLPSGFRFDRLEANERG
jgi:antitoxin MazE